MGERWCRGDVGYEREDRVLEKGSASGREEAALALALGRGLGRSLARSQATEERGAAGARLSDQPVPVQLRDGGEEAQGVGRKEQAP